MRSATSTTRRIAASIAISGTLLLGACAPDDRSAVAGARVFDDEVTLSRGSDRDGAVREFSSGKDSIYVAMAYENGADVSLRLSHDGPTPSSVEVESFMLDSGVEIAVLDVPLGTRLRVALSGSQDFDSPRTIPLEVFRYDSVAADSPRQSARIAAMRAWAAATSKQLSGADIPTKSIPQIDAALEYFESADGDPVLAAWGHYLRARFNYRRMTDLKTALADVRLAVKGFAALGDSENTARAHFLEATVLIEIATDSTASDPTADDAAREATRLLTQLRNDTALSAFDRARCVGYLGANHFNTYQWKEAEEEFLGALELYEGLGYQHGRRQVLGNLGVLASESGDDKKAVQYFERLMPEIDRVSLKSQRVLLLFNAAIVYVSFGNTDRAIEWLMKAQDLAQSTGLKQYDSLILNGLSRAYWARGDILQATTLGDEALRMRRTLDAGIPLMIVLRANGRLARARGDIKAALALHQEAHSLSFTPDLKVISLLDIARDHAAAHDYARGIDFARQALAVPMAQADFYNHLEGKLTLAEMLLGRPRPSATTVNEAAALIEDVLGAANRRADILLEIAARRLKAQALVARREYAVAREEYERAIALIFRYRSTINNPELRAATRQHEQKAFIGYADLLMRDSVRRQAGALVPTGEGEEGALRTLEWARAQKAYASSLSSLDAATQARVADLLAKMASKRVRIAALQDRTRTPTREMEIIQLDIARLRAEVDSLRASASRNASASPSPTTVDARWPELPKGITQLSYSFDTDRPYLWVRTAQGIQSTTLGVRREQLALELDTLIEATHTRMPAKVEAQLAKLSKVLVPPGAISAETTTVEIAIDEDTLRIPFAALLSPESSGGRLSDSTSIVMIASMFDPRETPHASHRRALRFAALAGEAKSREGSPASQVFPTLQGTNDEVRAIATMFSERNPKSAVNLMFGADGSASNLKKTWYDGVDVIHFATHGLADLRQPLTSLVVLPALDANGAPTYLTAGQVQEWRGDADLVYLSACDTAVGHGMQSAFLRAGARGVVATLWPVEDVYASQFARDFYRRYVAGVPASQALSETQRAWTHPAVGIRESEQGHRRMTAWAHAFYAQ